MYISRGHDVRVPGNLSALAGTEHVPKKRIAAGLGQGPESVSRYLWAWVTAASPRWDARLRAK